MIVICAKEDDDHVVAVSSILQSQHGEDVFVFDTSAFPSQVSLTGSFGLNGENLLLQAKNRQIPLQDVTSFWWRRPQPMEIDQAISDPASRNFTFQECISALYGVLVCCDGLWVNNMHSDIAAEYKPFQLKVARELDFLLPDTLITNNPRHVMDFWESKNRAVIYKAFNQRGLVWRPTRPLTEQDMGMLNNVSYAPVIFQAYVPGVRDVRVTVVGDQIYATEFDIEQLDSVDYRTTMASLPCRPHTIPAELESKIRQLMQKLKLEYGGVDFRLTHNGEYVFFEINTAGEFMYLQKRTEQPIANAMASLLAAGKPVHSHTA